jgi:NTP pyrophosphatase (non-canonical NTP hydrolase)
MEDTKKRKQVTQEQIDDALKSLGSETQRRLKQKGFGTFASTHEILGLIAEEYDELKDAIRSNNTDEVFKEIHDIGVVCHFAIACINSNTLDW